MSILLSVLFLLFPNGNHPTTAPKVSLRVDIQNIRTQKGAVYVALFRPGKDFPQGNPAEGKKIDITSSANVQATFSVEPGDYAVAIYHDENGNGKMDKRMFGIPKEPYGFSNNFHPTLSIPKFTDCKFSVGDGGKTISIKLI